MESKLRYILVQKKKKENPILISIFLVQNLENRTFQLQLQRVDNVRYNQYAYCVKARKKSFNAILQFEVFAR